jgi:hypothetical protein
MDEIRLSPSVREKVQAEREKIRTLTRADHEYSRDVILRRIGDLEEQFGIRNATYSETMGITVPIPKTREPTTNEWGLLFALNEMVLEMNKLCVSGEIEPKLRPMEYMAGLASASGIAFKEPTSKFAVPFPFGATLEKLAARYLNDPNRWMEIAALNGLREPYVDEEGFSVDVTSPGKGNEISVTSVANMYIGQTVYVVANGVAREKRRIEDITEWADGTPARLLLDGNPDLERFTPMLQAKVETFLPDTVNSQMTIFIPSDAISDDEDFQTKAIPGVDMLDPYVRAGGIDLLLTEDGDIALTNDGDVRLAVGLTNLVQRARVAMSTPRGSILHHPDFGLGIKVGNSVADVNAASIIASVKQMFTNDSSFTGVDYATVRIEGGTASIDMTVGIAGTNKTLPLTFALK